LKSKSEMEAKITVEQAKDIANSFLQAYYQLFDNGPRDNLANFYVSIGPVVISR
jgi:hypothetical protein